MSVYRTRDARRLPGSSRSRASSASRLGTPGPGDDLHASADASGACVFAAQGGGNSAWARRPPRLGYFPMTKSILLCSIVFAACAAPEPGEVPSADSLTAESARPPTTLVLPGN